MRDALLIIMVLVALMAAAFIWTAAHAWARRFLDERGPLLTWLAGWGMLAVAVILWLWAQGQP